MSDDKGIDPFGCAIAMLIWAALIALGIELTGWLWHLAKYVFK